ncbi:MAG: hypothetical protein ACAI25_01485 [Planctomycetota bacterium]
MVEAGWVCVCGRTNRAFSCPRCGKSKPADAESVPIEGAPGLTQKHARSWFELGEDELKSLTAGVVGDAPPAPGPAPSSGPAWMTAPAPATPSSATPRARPTSSFNKATVDAAPAPERPSTPRPMPRTTGVIKTEVEALSLRDRIDQQLSEFASARTRDWICIVVGLLVAFFATRAEMKHWSARQIIDDEIMRGPGDIRETIPRNIEQKVGVKLKPEELQFVGVTEAGMRDGGIDCTVTIRSPSAGFYEQHARVIKITPNRPRIFGFDFQPGREGVWVVERWRQVMRLSFIGFGLLLLTVCGIRRGTASD